MRRPLIWLLLIAISLALHGLVSSRVGEEIKQTQAATEALNAIAEREKRQVVLEVAKNQIPEVKMEEPPTDEPLDFEEDFQLDPPEVLIAPQAVAPPPPNVPLSLTAQAGGAGEDTQPVEIAIAQQDSAGANLARQVFGGHLAVAVHQH